MKTCEGGIDVVVVVEILVPRAYWRVALASGSTLSGSVVRTLRGGEGFPKTFCLVALSQYLRLLFAKRIQRGRVEEIGMAFSRGV